jgi:UDP-glucose:(heptosyl)LPS alpha-1,3-glucosyltransferase
MRLALVHKRYDRIGGAEWDCFELSRQLAARGHEVHVVVGESRAPAPDGITMHRVPVVRAGQLAKLLSFTARAPAVWRALDADVVIGFGRTIGHDLFRVSGGCHRGYLARVAAERGAFEAVRQRLSPYQQAILAIERRQYARGAYRKILAVSELSRDEILSLYPAVARDDVGVLHYGVDAERFRPENRARHGADVRRELGVPLEQPMVLLVGSGFVRKGVDTLLAVWRRQPPSGATLVVVGNDQHLAARRREAVAIAGGVIFTGARRDVERLYAAADVFALPSLYEGCPVAILEALASGLPVVTSRATGAPELLTGRLGDLLVDDPRDQQGVAAALARGLDAAQRPALCAAARAAALENSLDRSVERFEEWCRVIAVEKGRQVTPARERGC